MHLALRIGWFVLIGWWLGVLWFLLAMVAALTVIWYNVGLFMAVNTWKLMTLEAPPREILEEIREIR